jgi:hypothetical protein
MVSTKLNEWMQVVVLFVVVVSASLIFVAPVSAQEADPSSDVETRNCIFTRQIRRTKIIDDRNVLFYVAGDTVFHNALRQTCHGLEKRGTFALITSGRLCEGDGFSAVYTSPYPTCWLGVHVKITRDEADAMMAAKKEGGKIEVRPLPMPEPSEVGVENEDPE